MNFKSKYINNSSLIIFRIFLGFLIVAESFGAIFTGWVKRIFIDSLFTFNHIGFNWLQVFHGQTMYFYYIIMGILGLCVMFGFRYKWAMTGFTLLWFGTYLMQKEAYNNHYYLLFLICFIMCFLPANANYSIDSMQNPNIKSSQMPQWIVWIMITQISFVYLFSVVAKCYPGWLDGSFVNIMFSEKMKHPIFGTMFQNQYFQNFIIYSGIIFDLLIIPLLLWKKSRNLALILSILFHIFNAIVLEIGIFPFFALSFIVFFYDSKIIKNIFFKKQEECLITKNQDHLLYYIFIPFLIIQFLLPLRHYFIEKEVLWTEEGHRLSWRMMLRSRSGSIAFNVVDLKNNHTYVYDYTTILTPKQIEWFNNKPDAIWQMAQYIKKEYYKKNTDVAIFVKSYVSINGGKYVPFINPKVDLAKAKWNYFKHNPWILTQAE